MENKDKVGKSENSKIQQYLCNSIAQVLVSISIYPVHETSNLLSPIPRLKISSYCGPGHKFLNLLFLSLSLIFHLFGLIYIK